MNEGVNIEEDLAGGGAADKRTVSARSAMMARRCSMGWDVEAGEVQIAVPTAIGPPSLGRLVVRSLANDVPSNGERERRCSE
jgi:hypothetical protein